MEYTFLVDSDSPPAHTPPIQRGTGILDPAFEHPADAMEAVSQPGGFKSNTWKMGCKWIDVGSITRTTVGLIIFSITWGSMSMVPVYWISLGVGGQVRQESRRSPWKERSHLWSSLGSCVRILPTAGGLLEVEVGYLHRPGLAPVSHPSTHTHNIWTSSVGHFACAFCTHHTNTYIHTHQYITYIQYSTCVHFRLDLVYSFDE